ncbi:hypothetical protein F4808DRAFT_175950 [Astrocystis sublimbata]|nr:hypothetical protein F4808DRAFT_175950 [Astrocystis sublimbata]
MATYTKPARTSRPGHPNKLIYARTSVLCNGQIAWKVGQDRDMEFSRSDARKAELRPIEEAEDDLNALNGLQVYRSKPLTPLEVKQPLRHVQSSLPSAVKARVYTGDLYGSTDSVFFCPNSLFQATCKRVFGNDVRADGAMNYNDFFRRLRRAEWLLWDVEADEGHWVAVIAHLYKSPIRNPNKKLFKEDGSIPSSVPSPDFNRIDEWCVVTPERSPQGRALVQRVRRRLPTILLEGNIRFDSDSEIQPALWIPEDDTDWSSGLRIFALIKTLMHRVAEFHCKGRGHQPSFWHPTSGWLNIDEVRAEMQGRAAQRCMGATGYRSRIAIEGVHRWIGIKEVVLAKELRPRRSDCQAYYPGRIGEDGHCVPVGLEDPPSDVVDDELDDNYGEGPSRQPAGGKDPSGRAQGGEVDPVDDIRSRLTPPNSQRKGKQVSVSRQPTEDKYASGGAQGVEVDPVDDVDDVQSWLTPPDSRRKGKQVAVSRQSTPTPWNAQDLPKWPFQEPPDVNKFGGTFKTVTPRVRPGVGGPGPRTTSKRDAPPDTSSHTHKKSRISKSSGEPDLSAPANPPPSHARGVVDINTFARTPRPLQGLLSNTDQKNPIPGVPMSPLSAAPSWVYGWDDETTDEGGPFRHVPLTKLAINQAVMEAQQDEDDPAQSQTGQNKPGKIDIRDPLPLPPTREVGWDIDPEEDPAPYYHLPLTKLAIAYGEDGLREILERKNKGKMDDKQNRKEAKLMAREVVMDMEKRRRNEDE